ncbi:MAG TPA: hypothetical protein VGG75_01965 [Trebonia sp.]
MKNVSRRWTASASPPMALISPPTSCGTSQVYWAALPSWKPDWPKLLHPYVSGPSSGNWPDPSRGSM